MPLLPFPKATHLAHHLMPLQAGPKILRSRPIHDPTLLILTNLHPLDPGHQRLLPHQFFIKQPPQRIHHIVP